MTKPIRSYDELLRERKRLELLLLEQKLIIYDDIHLIKEELRPVRNTFQFIKKLMTQDKTSLLLNLGSEIAIDSLITKFILSRAGWLTKIVIPFFLKNFSSHFLAEQKEKWLEKLKTWISHRNGKEHKEDSSYAENKRDVE